LTAAVPYGEISIPVAEINRLAFEDINLALLNGEVVEATLTSEGKY